LIPEFQNKFLNSWGAELKNSWIDFWNPLVEFLGGILEFDSGGLAVKVSGNLRGIA